MAMTRTSTWLWHAGGSAQEINIEVEALEAGRYAVTMEGKRRIVDASFSPDGGVSLLIDGDSHFFRFDEGSDGLVARSRTHTIPVSLFDARNRGVRAGQDGRSGGTQTLKAPMPGKVVKVLVARGDKVSEGQGLVVIEAMKMENELKAAIDGKVAKVEVQEGSAVEKGTLLVVIEPQ